MTADIYENPYCVEPYECGETPCSHLYWHCTSCDEKGGHGLPQHILEQQAENHNMVECPAMFEHG